MDLFDSLEWKSTDGQKHYKKTVDLLLGWDPKRLYVFLTDLLFQWKDFFPLNNKNKNKKEGTTI